MNWTDFTKHQPTKPGRYVILQPHATAACFAYWDAERREFRDGCIRRLCAWWCALPEMPK